MSKGVHLMTWVTPDVKRRFGAAAQARGFSESALLRYLVDTAIVGIARTDIEESLAVDPLPKDLRVFIRLRPTDHHLLRARASARSLASSAYIALLVRSHLHRLTPLPTAELEGFKAAVSELGAVGRNLNQIARAANRGDGLDGQNAAELRKLYLICVGMRDHFKALMHANSASWESGYEKTPG